jgi:hypothetical protein
LGWAGIASALGILIGLLEPAGLALAGTINAVAYILWSLWLVGTGVSLLRARPEVAHDPAPTIATGGRVPGGARP